MSWGRLVETVVGAHLCKTAPPDMTITYWRERNHEVDFVLRCGDKLRGVEVKSGRNKGSLAGLARFTQRRIADLGHLPVDKTREVAVGA